jgi:hypothetical protein
VHGEEDAPGAKRQTERSKAAGQDENAAAEKVVNIKRVIAGRTMAEELQKTVVSQHELAGFDPAHAAYVFTQNKVSVSERITALKQ